MKIKLLIVGIAVVTALTGCATSTTNYAPPIAKTVQNNRQINQSFETVWDRLVKQLSSDFFVINNIDKNSRLINLSFSSQRPSDFVDCGRTSRTFKNARGDQNYTYNTADSSQFTSTNTEGHAFNVRRTAKLEGRTNIYVAPEGIGTLVSVNTKYVVNVTMSAIGFDGRNGGTENFTFDFSTKQPFTDGQISCMALGVIESKILGLADNNDPNTLPNQ